MFRSGDPPHIGQSVTPFEAPEEDTCTAATSAMAMSHVDFIFMSRCISVFSHEE
jgi:hypothetical protein